MLVLQYRLLTWPYWFQTQTYSAHTHMHTLSEGFFNIYQIEQPLVLWMLPVLFIFLRTLKSLSDFPIISISFRPNFLCWVCFRMLFFPCVLWKFHLNTNLKWGFLVFVFLFRSPWAISLYMMARAFLSHCLRLSVSVSSLNFMWWARLQFPSL